MIKKMMKKAIKKRGAIDGPIQLRATLQALSLFQGDELPRPSCELGS
jgi:hypothetical protein